MGRSIDRNDTRNSPACQQAGFSFFFGLLFESGAAYYPCADEVADRMERIAWTPRS